MSWWKRLLGGKGAAGRETAAPLAETAAEAGAPVIGETGRVLGAPVRPPVAPLSALAAPCSSPNALAGLLANCCSMVSAGMPGTAGGAAGSAAAPGLSASAAEQSPAAAIALAANSFAVRDMLIPIARLQVFTRR